MNEQMYTFAEAAERCLLSPEKLQQVLALLHVPVEVDAHGDPVPVSAEQIRYYQEMMAEARAWMRTMDAIADGHIPTIPIMDHEGKVTFRPVLDGLRWQKSRELLGE